MKVINVLLICFLIVSCSSTKVHLYSRYLSEKEVDNITKTLEEHNFDVVANELDFPRDIEQSTLLYSPFIQGEDSVNVLIDALDKTGWVISNVQPLFSGNHYYTKNSVGLLLLPEGVTPKDNAAANALINEYDSQGCDLDVKLRLLKNGDYSFEYIEGNPNQIDHLQGRWKVTSYPFVELSSTNKEWFFYFEIQQKIEVDVVGKVEITQLIPVEKYYLLPHCRFVYGIR
jgi:hypothetical protein